MCSYDIIICHDENVVVKIRMRECDGNSIGEL